MSRIRDKDTKPELVVRSMLHQMGYRFRLHRSDLPGKPDIVLPKYKIVIQVYGCFWHRHQGCKMAYIPKTRKHFWMEKFTKNVERDRKQQKQLEKLGWQLLVVWECETNNLKRLANKLSTAIEGTKDQVCSLRFS
jgi:DNA mismatch endonuclease, patch repair protein